MILKSTTKTITKFVEVELGEPEAEILKHFSAIPDFLGKSFRVIEVEMNPDTTKVAKAGKRFVLLKGTFSTASVSMTKKERDLEERLGNMEQGSLLFRLSQK